MPAARQGALVRSEPPPTGGQADTASTFAWAYRTQQEPEQQAALGVARDPPTSPAAAEADGSGAAATAAEARADPLVSQASGAVAPELAAAGAVGLEADHGHLTPLGATASLGPGQETGPWWATSCAAWAAVLLFLGAALGCLAWSGHAWVLMPPCLGSRAPRARRKGSALEADSRWSQAHGGSGPAAEKIAAKTGAISGWGNGAAHATVDSRRSYRRTVQGVPQLHRMVDVGGGASSGSGHRASTCAGSASRGREAESRSCNSEGGGARRADDASAASPE